MIKLFNIDDVSELLCDFNVYVKEVGAGLFSNSDLFKSSAELVCLTPNERL